jgi:hypothetical protein
VKLAEELRESEHEHWTELRDLLTAYAARQPVRKVAVVGNAPLSASAERAAEVDTADLVIRCNSFVLDDNGNGQPFTGSQVHIVLLNKSTRITPCVFQNYRRRLYLLPQGGYTAFRSVRPTPAHWPADLGAWPLSNQVAIRRLNDLLLPVREPGSLIPTTGMLSVFLAHELFPDTDLVATGFSFLKNRDQTEWQHHIGGTVPVHGAHRIDLEGALLESWIAEGGLRFFD